MHRIDGADVDEDLHGAGKDGFTSGNTVTGEPATEVTDDWLNAVQEEVIGVIEGAGLTLDKNNNGQLLEAINALIDAAVNP